MFLIKVWFAIKCSVGTISYRKQLFDSKQLSPHLFPVLSATTVSCVPQPLDIIQISNGDLIEIHSRDSVGSFYHFQK